MGTNARSQGDVGRIMVVLLTDGRANISLGRSNDDPEALTVKPGQASSLGTMYLLDVKLMLHASETRNPQSVL